MKKCPICEGSGKIPAASYMKKDGTTVDINFPCKCIASKIQKEK